MCSGLEYDLFGNGEQAQTKEDYSAFPFQRVKEELERQRIIEKYFYGDYYPLTQYSQAEDAWEAYQLDLPEKQEGLVVVLKRPLSDYVSAPFPLMALDNQSSYEIINMDTGERRAITGRNSRIEAWN